MHFREITFLRCDILFSRTLYTHEGSPIGRPVKLLYSIAMSPLQTVDK